MLKVPSLLSSKATFAEQFLNIGANNMAIWTAESKSLGITLQGTYRPLKGDIAYILPKVKEELAIRAFHGDFKPEEKFQVSIYQNQKALEAKRRKDAWWMVAKPARGSKLNLKRAKPSKKVEVTAEPVTGQSTEEVRH